MSFIASHAGLWLVLVCSCLVFAAAGLCYCAVVLVVGVVVAKWLHDDYTYLLL